MIRSLCFALSLVFCFGLTESTSSCRYSGPLGVIDITTLGNTDGTAAFSHVSPGPKSEYEYSYNPCKPFSTGSCINVSACQISIDSPVQDTIGLQDTIQWNVSDSAWDNPSIIYTYADKTTHISLVCGGDYPWFEWLGDYPMSYHRFRLTHKCACWNACDPNATTTTVTTTTVSPTAACRYEGPRGVIDLTSLALTNGTADFTDISQRTDSSYEFSYNPCKVFTQSNCVNVAACLKTVGSNDRSAIGLQETALWNDGYSSKDLPTVTYTFNEKTTIVTLICGNETAQFEPITENPKNTFRFNLTHKCACWNGCVNKTQIESTTDRQTSSIRATMSTSAPPTSCRYQGPKGVIDLTSVGRTDGTASFLNVSAGPASSYTYSYNPCAPFNQSECVNVAACQISLDQLYVFSIGLQETATWAPSGLLGSLPKLIYTSGEKRVEVSLICDKNKVEFEALGEEQTNLYKFRLRHRCACWDECSGSGPVSTTTVSFATKLSIDAVLFVFVALIKFFQRM